MALGRGEVVVLSYPILPPRDTVYASLNLGPEATMADVREAKNSMTRTLDEERRVVEQRLARVFDAVPGLREAREEARRPGHSQTAPDREGQPRTRLIELERQADAAFPEYRRLRNRLDEISEEVAKLNLIPLQAPDKRRAYDRENPPLTILALAPEPSDAFADNRIALRLVRRDLSAFLEGIGVPVFHPSDLTRTDFYTDFTWTRGLDSDQ
jgi:hypothetical protein